MRTDVVVVPVLRAGLGMLDAVLELLPAARVGHIGLQRDEATAIASRYYSKLPPDLADSYVLMIDPMLATGGSAVAAIDLIKAAGARDHPHDLHRRRRRKAWRCVERHHPDVVVYTPVIDRELNAHKFIVPGPRRLRRPALRDRLTRRGPEAGRHFTAITIADGRLTQKGTLHKD